MASIDRLIDRYTEDARAIAMAINREHRHVSMVFRRRRLIAIGTNISKTHPDARIYRFQEVHSELDAFKKIDYTLRNKLILVNFRFNKRGEMRMSRPCGKCLPWVINVFDNVYYSTDNGILKMEHECTQ